MSKSNVPMKSTEEENVKIIEKGLNNSTIIDEK